MHTHARAHTYKHTCSCKHLLSPWVPWAMSTLIKVLTDGYHNRFGEMWLGLVFFTCSGRSATLQGFCLGVCVCVCVCAAWLLDAQRGWLWGFHVGIRIINFALQSSQKNPAINIYITHLVVVVICEEVFPQSSTMSNSKKKFKLRKTVWSWKKVAGK